MTLSGVGRMMQARCRAIFRQELDIRTGRVLPATSGLTLNGGAAELQATFLYADMANSSHLLTIYGAENAAKILQMFHAANVLAIRNQAGHVTSFDGDRVMAVFIGRQKEQRAVACGLRIAWALGEAINPLLASAGMPAVTHCTGIDSGTVLAVKAGAHGDNDRVWLGRPPNLAARLSEERHPPYYTIISETVYHALPLALQANGAGLSRWKNYNLKFGDQAVSVYASSSGEPL